METPKKKGIAPLTIAPVRDAMEEVFDLVAPYAAWKLVKLADPRTASAAVIGDGLAKIIAAEGPMLDHRAFALYTRAAGLSRASRAIVSTYAKALKLQIKAGRIEAEADLPEFPAQVLRMAGKPRLALRERGDRTIDEIPVLEITALVRKLELDRGEAVASQEERFRRVLGVYALVRLTANTKERLTRACARANLPEWSKALSSTFEPEGPLAAPRKRRIIRPLRHG